jgi:hypothetical protein
VRPSGTSTIAVAATFYLPGIDDRHARRDSAQPDDAATTRHGFVRPHRSVIVAASGDAACGPGLATNMRGTRRDPCVSPTAEARRSRGETCVRRMSWRQARATLQRRGVFLCLRRTRCGRRSGAAA